MHALRIISQSFLTIALIALALSGGARAQALTDLCLKSGVTVHALRIESRDGLFIITPKGQNSPTVTISADQVKEVGVSCQEAQKDPAPASTQGPSVQPQPGFTGGVTQTASGAVKFGVYGSDVIGAKLMPLLIEAWAKKRGWSAVSRPGENGGQEIELTAAGASRPSAVIDLKLTDVAEGFAALADGRTAFTMSTRRPTPEEAARMKSRSGVDLLTAASGGEHVVALDALAVIVHRDNPIKNLRLDQIADIFSGRTANWKDVHGWNEIGEDVNGEEGQIHIHSLDPAQESFDLFKTKVLSQANTALAPSAFRHDSPGKLSRAVGRDKYAIGFTPFANTSKNDILDINTKCGLASGGSPFSVKIEQYPIMRRLYMYTPAEPRHELAREFLNFALSDEGQVAVADAGFINLAIALETKQGMHRWLAAIQANPFAGLLDGQLTGAAKQARQAELDSADMKTVISLWARSAKLSMQTQYRTSALFRFENNSSELDARALRDIERLGRFLKSSEQSLFNMVGTEYTLTGFADSVGSYAHNAKLSRARAQNVDDHLHKLGVRHLYENLRDVGKDTKAAEKKSPKHENQVKDASSDITIARTNELKRLYAKYSLGSLEDTGAYGASSFAPLACNDTDEGKALNRRVEAWIKAK